MIIREIILTTLLVLSTILLILSIPLSGLIDKTLINSASYVLENLPETFYLGFALTLIALIWTVLHSDKHVSPYIMSLILYLIYLEYPRFLYPNAFQIEYFHQAQIYHVLNYGSVTDPGYSSPKSDVAHAIFTASLLLVTDLPKHYVVSYAVPILVKIALLLIAIAMSMKYSKVTDLKLYKTLLMLLPLYILISDTEPLFINHYSYALPLYLLLLFIIIRKGLGSESRPASHIVIFTLVLASLTITHIYFSTASIIALLAILLFTSLHRNRVFTPQLYILPIFVYSVWHVMASNWSIRIFIAEFSILSVAFTRLVTFQLNPLKSLKHVEERFDSIPIKPDYQLYFVLKWFDILILQVLMIALIATSILLEGKRVIKILFKKDITYFMFIAITTFILFVGTFTAHPQRVLEHLVLTLAAFTIVVIQLAKCSKRTRWVKAIILSTIFAITISAPIKLIHYWGTSLTYIGFPEKTIYMLSYFAKHTWNPIDKPIHYVGQTPYWFLTEILDRKQHFYPISLNGPESSAVLSKTLENLNATLSATTSHYVIIDLSTLLPMRSKYSFDQYVEEFTSSLINLSSRTNIILNINATHMIWVTS